MFFYLTASMMYTLLLMVVAVLAGNLSSATVAGVGRSLRQEAYSHGGQKALHEKELSGGMHLEGKEGKGAHPLPGGRHSR